MTTAHRPSCWICSQAKVWEEYGNPFCEYSKTDPAHVTWYLDQHDAGRNEHEIAIVCIAKGIDASGVDANVICDHHTFWIAIG